VVRKLVITSRTLVIDQPKWHSSDVNLNPLSANVVYIVIFAQIQWI